MKAIVFQHEEQVGLGLLGPVLKRAGFDIVTRFRAPQYEDVSADLVVSLGGPMGAYQTEAHPFLAKEISLLSERVAQQRPTLGICLGAQLLARAAGVEVAPGKNGVEVGVAPLRWTAAAQGDPVFAGIRAKLPVAHWHADTHAAVPGATLLASTDRYTQQAFRLGDSYAFQFHPELTAETLNAWYIDAQDWLRQHGKDLEALRAQLPKLKAAEQEWTEVLQRLAEHFRDVCS